MSLDLAEIIADWPLVEDDITARLIVGRAGAELLQMRIDMGLMQMVLEGRPDGARYRGMQTVQEHIEHELRIGKRGISRLDWQELLRELNQFNYRRLAYGSVADGFLEADEPQNAERMLRGAIGDIDFCLRSLELIAANPEDATTPEDEALGPTLVFNRGRHMTQLRVLQERFEDAIDEAEGAAKRLAAMLEEIGVEEVEEDDEDSGVEHLRKLARRLRNDYQIEQTLSERLQKAIDSEDFEAAARLRDEQRQREERDGTPPADDAPTQSN